MNAFYCKGFAPFLIALLCLTKSNAQQWITLGNENQVSAVSSNYTTITVIEDVPHVAYVETASTIAKVKKRNAATGQWEQVGNDIDTNVTYLRLYSDRSNKLFATYVDPSSSNKAAVMTLDPATQKWIPLIENNRYVSTGTVSSSISQLSSSTRTTMAFDLNNIPYISFAERTSTGNAYVKRFVGGQWETLSNGPVASTDFAFSTSITIDDNNQLYLAYVNHSSLSTYAGIIKLFRFNDISNSWEDISPPSPVLPGTATTGATTGARHTSLTLDSTFNPIISYFNTSNINKSTIIRYNRTSAQWNYIGTNGSRDAPHNTIYRDNGGNVFNIFVDYLSSTPTSMGRIYKLGYAAANFSEVKSPGINRGFDSVNVSTPSIASGTDSSKIYIAFTNKNASGVPLPVVMMYSGLITTKSLSNVTANSVSVATEISYDGGSTVTQRGVAYSTTANPTIANNKITDLTTTGNKYSLTINGLQSDQTYFVRSYFTNTNGTTYGNQLLFNTLPLPDAVITAPRQMEFLTRGTVAARVSTSKVFISWRLLGTDPHDITFNIYRDGIKLNAAPISNSTNYEDNTSSNGNYIIKPVINNQEGAGSSPVTVWAQNQLYIPIQAPDSSTVPDGRSYGYTANDCSVGDVDGDGEYEIFLRWEPSIKTDNMDGYTGRQIFDCYKLNGTRLWRIDLGKNMRAGQHYNQFMVYDFDGDGKAEMICKTADGTVDGRGVSIGDPFVDYRSTSGWVHNGPEYLTVFNGLTGAAMATVNFEPARGNVSSWGDSYGNRCDRFISAVAYLDGTRPSVVMGRGYYDRLVRAAYDWRNGQLTLRWLFDSKVPGNEAYSGMGNHQMTVGDVDGDGKDEIFNGSSAINDNGKRFWANGYGHGDALHMTDLDPDRPGQEIWQCLESPSSYSPYGLRFNDAKTGSTVWGVSTSGDIGRAMAADIDPTRKGYEVWGSSGNLYDCKGNIINTTVPTYNFGIWWDGDLCRELLDGTKLDKWNFATNSLNRLYTIYNAAPVGSNNGTKANPCLQADLIGDWREEMIFRTSDQTSLVIFTTTIPTTYRIPTLMHDPQYRTAIAWQNSAYNQPPYTSFYLGTDMTTPTAANIYIAGASLPVRFLSFEAKAKDQKASLTWSTTAEKNVCHFNIERSANGIDFTVIGVIEGKQNPGLVNRYSITDEDPLNGINFYRLKQVDKDGQFTYSDTRKLTFNSRTTIKVYPNPIINSVLVSIEGINTDHVSAYLTDMEGKITWQQTGNLSKVNRSLNNKLPGIKAGQYILTIITAAQKLSTKMIRK